MKTIKQNLPKILLSISGILYPVYIFFALAENALAANVLVPVICVFFFFEIIFILRDYSELHFYFAIYLFSEALWLISNIAWAFDSNILQADGSRDPFFIVPSIIALIMQAMAVLYLIINKYTKWNRYSFISKYFLVLSFSILFTNKLSSARYLISQNNMFYFIALVCMVFIFAGVFTIAISIHGAVRYPSFIMYILGYLFIIFGNYLYMVPSSSIIYMYNELLPDIIVIGGNFLLILSFYLEKKYPWLSFQIDDKDVQFNKKLYINISFIIMLIFTLLYIFELIEAPTALVAEVICLCFIFLVSEQHSRMLAEQLYIQKKAENDHLERLVERRTNALRIANEQLREAVTVDALTGLYNRCEYMSRIRERVENNDTTPLSVICANVRNFKKYNMDYGYETGDLILSVIGKRLIKLQDDNFLVFRIDGNEFLILTWGDYEKAEIEELLRYIRHIIEEPIIDGKHIYKVDTTFSYVMYPEEADSQEALLAIAENSLIKAKNEL